jgi:hypothetical protein
VCKQDLGRGRTDGSDVWKQENIRTYKSKRKIEHIKEEEKKKWGGGEYEEVEGGKVKEGKALKYRRRTKIRKNRN